MNSMEVLSLSALCTSLLRSMLPIAIDFVAGNLQLIAPNGARAVNGRRWRDNREQVRCKAKTSIALRSTANALEEFRVGNELTMHNAKIGAVPPSSVKSSAT